ncbi:hypothetical protein P691DRAFT_782908 [Macrolepiota fuliginosa MF-IS2]|uniref:Uncharacterized protein n=1 Tax=Macrolepiota fuliginosa MF-IS2 TaxID=1400762 RepID=A0A9P5XCJ9_9AGAR|nr:hypothetical protein P691DRAFT_782908 [Macrolepiota fuliginosa MF-IS2]
MGAKPKTPGGEIEEERVGSPNGALDRTPVPTFNGRGGGVKGKESVVLWIGRIARTRGGKKDEKLAIIEKQTNAVHAPKIPGMEEEREEVGKAWDRGKILHAVDSDSREGTPSSSLFKKLIGTFETIY